MYAIIDIETTGGKFNQEHIMEIAVFVFDGKTIVDQFITLVNPEAPIQPYVSKITGITENMLRRSPKFYEIAKRIVKITEDCVFVAHNVKFDYRVVQLEFERLGFDFHRKTLDTIDLTKALIPDLKAYGLEAVCQELGITNLNRHRADGDARATVELFKILLEKDSEKTISKLSRSREESENQHPFKDLVRPLKNVTGLYYLYNSAGEVIYIGMGTDLQNNINRHFLATNKNATKLQAEVNSIGIEETGNLAIAYIKEFTELRRLKPIYNHTRYTSFLPVGLFASKVEKRATFVRIHGVRSHQADLYFKDADDAYQFLLNIVVKHQLDAETLLMEKDYTILKPFLATKNVVPTNKDLAVLNLKKAFFEHPNFLAIGAGRHANEKSLILVEKYQVKGYAYYELESFLENLEQIKKHLVPIAPHPFVPSLLRHFLDGNTLRIKVLE